MSKNKVRLKSKDGTFALINIGNRKAVEVRLAEDRGLLSFITPIKRSDFNKNGELLPRALGSRRKNQIITSLILSPEALLALRDILNELLPLPEEEENYVQSN